MPLPGKNQSKLEKESMPLPDKTQQKSENPPLPTKTKIIWSGIHQKKINIFLK